MRCEVCHRDPCGGHRIGKLLEARSKPVQEMAKVARQAIWLSRLCSAWLHYHGGNHRAARLDLPYDPAASGFAPANGAPDAELIKEIKTARKECGYWEPQRIYYSRFKMLKKGPTTYPAQAPLPAPRTLSSWVEVYDSWQSGSLDRGIDDLLWCLPKSTRNKLKELHA